MKFTVTRQSQWATGDQVVEISEGGLDYSNADALVQKYPGEFEEFDDPRDAVETAIKIAEAWQKDCPDKEILISMGTTHGMSIPFEGEPLDEDTFKGLREQAEKIWEATPKCDRCGDCLPQHPYHLIDDPDFGKFCSENCADNAWHDWQREMDEAEEEDDDEEELEV